MNEVARGFAFLMVLASPLPMPARQSPAHPHGGWDGTAWSELGKSMEKMHADMGSVRPSGNDDADFVKLMLPHHQAAIDMAKTELLHGKDSQMRRLAQEIITDQQSEIELMQLWLKQHGTNSPGVSHAPASEASKGK